MLVGSLGPRLQQLWLGFRTVLGPGKFKWVRPFKKKKKKKKKRLGNVYLFKPFVPIRNDAALPLLPTVDLTDSSLIQHVLLRQSLQEARGSTLSVQQIFQALQELFQRVRVEKPGQVHPRASELTLSLLTTMYDR